MKKILISIRPEWVAKILHGVKTIEVRKTAPKCELPCEVYIYCTKGQPCLFAPNDKNERYFIVNRPFATDFLNGKVVAKFTLNKAELIRYGTHGIGYYPTETPMNEMAEKSCLYFDEVDDYLKRKDGYGWHIDDLVIFDKPKGLEEFEFPNPSGIRYIGQRAIKGLPSKKRPPQSWCYVEVSE